MANKDFFDFDDVADFLGIYDTVIDKKARIESFQISEEGKVELQAYEETGKDQQIKEHLEWFKHEFYTWFKRDISYLLLTPKNELNVEKFVCSTIRPTFTSIPELYDYQSCSQYISNIINFMPLYPPNLFPEYIPSPSNVLKWQEGDCFDMSILLTSILIGNGYDAFCVYGYAPKSVTTKDTTLMDCPAWLQEDRDFTPNVKSWIDLANQNDLGEGENSEETKSYKVDFKVEDKVDFNYSEFRTKIKDVRNSDQTSLNKEQANIWSDNVPDLQEEDKFEGKRLHCWVLIKNTKRGLTKNIFIEPSTGTEFLIDESPYESVLAIFNNRNYWLNIKEDCAVQDMNYDLTNKDYWHGIIWYPEDYQTGNNAQLGGLNDDEANETQSQGTRASITSTYEVPHPWSPPLVFDRKKLLELCPMGYKVLNYRKLRVELFGKYKQPDGLVKRYTYYDDYRKVVARTISSYFSNREDHLVNEIRQPFFNMFEYNYAPGRSDKEKEAIDKDKSEHIKKIVKIDGFWRKYWFYPYRIDCLLEREENLFRVSDEEKESPHPIHDFVDPKNNTKKKFNFIVEKFVEREEKISKRKYYIDFEKNSFNIDSRNQIETDLIKPDNKERANEIKKFYANILKILLWIEPSTSKGKANSLHEVVFDFSNNITTWVNHREKGKLNPECWYHASNADERKAMDMLFERGFIPSRNNRGKDELDQIANYLSQELVIACKNDMSNISSRLNKWRSDNLSNERGIADSIRDTKQSAKDEKSGVFGALKMNVYDKVLIDKSDRPANTGQDLKTFEEDKNKDFDFVENIIKAEGLDSKKTGFSTDEAYDIVSKCEEYLRERIIKRAANISDKLEKLSQEYKNRVTEKGSGTNDNNAKTSKEIEDLSFKISIYIERAAKHEENALKMYQELTDRLRKDPRFKLYFEADKN